MKSIFVDGELDSGEKALVNISFCEAIVESVSKRVNKIDNIRSIGGEKDVYAFFHLGDVGVKINSTLEDAQKKLKALEDDFPEGDLFLEMYDQENIGEVFLKNIKKASKISPDKSKPGTPEKLGSYKKISGDCTFFNFDGDDRTYVAEVDYSDIKQQLTRNSNSGGK